MRMKRILLQQKICRRRRSQISQLATAKNETCELQQATLATKEKIEHIFDRLQSRRLSSPSNASSAAKEELSSLAETASF